jgi:hypothetical protein
MPIADDRTRANALPDQLVGPFDEAAKRTVAVLNAHAAALSWVRDTTGSYPAPDSVANELRRVAGELRSGADRRYPATALGQAAVDALAAHRRRLMTGNVLDDNRSTEDDTAP